MDKKLIVILGQTATGKSDLAVKLAKKFNGEVISADSRQVYRGMNLGTGKITKSEMQGVPHYLLDVASPKRQFSIAQYQKLAHGAIKKIFKKNKLLILCGGTAFYIYSIVDGIIFPHVRPDWRLRKKLEKKSASELFKILKKIDPSRAKTVEKKNPRRLIRALEIIITTKKPVPKLKKNPFPYPILMIGIKKSQKELKARIKKRLQKRIKQGMIAEVRKLKKSGLSWRRLEDFGLEYRQIARYLQKKISHKEMIEKLQKDIEHFSKRQMTWFKRDARIKWVINHREAEKIIKKFLSNASRGREVSR